MYYFKVNNKQFETSKSSLTGMEILSIASLNPVEDYELLLKINSKGYVPIQLNEKVDFTQPGIEGLKAKPYNKLKIKVDENQYEVEECFMTPLEIMELAGINPNIYFLMEIRNGNVEISYKDDVEHKIAITKKSCFISVELDKINCVIVNAREKPWSNFEISFNDVVMLAFGEVSTNPNVIYTITYKRGVPSKPEGSMVKGEVINVKNKMIFNVTQTNRS